ncbi:MAG: hypothetical protein RXN93_07790 [Thermocladium sp.]
MEAGEKRVYYFTFEELYHSSRNSYPQGNPDTLAANILKFYGYKVELAFSIVNDAPRDASPILMSVGDANHPWMKRLMELLDEYDYYEAAEKLLNEDGNNAIAIIVYDGYDVGLAIGFPQ